MQDINLGHFRINDRGEFNNTAQYQLLDGVKYNGGYYMCKNDDTIDGIACIGILPEGQDISKKYWVCMAEKGDKGDIAPQYDSFITLSNNIWDYSESDKIVIPENLSINQLIINNVYDGCCGMIVTKQDITLPDNSDYSVDYYYAEVMNTDEYYVYTFVYRSTSSNSGRFMWNRTVYGYKVVD